LVSILPGSITVAHLLRRFLSRRLNVSSTSIPRPIKLKL
jgi:hypothetical protein